MMAFITHYWKNARLEVVALLACAAFLACLSLAARAESAAPEVAPLRLERGGESLTLSTSVKFELANAVEDALLKGIPVIFVAEADVYRDRWYWTDKKVANAQRHMRLVYQPLIRRWRLVVATGVITSSGLGVVLSQNFDTLTDALGSIRRLSGWRIAELEDIDAGARHRVDFRFRLDTSQLPRSLQIGTLGESDWALVVSATQRFTLESLK